MPISLQQLRPRVLDFLFPRVCTLCRESFPTSPPNDTCFCDSCREQLCVEIPHSCSRCAAEVGPYSNTVGGCVHCRKYPFRFDHITCLGMYDKRLREAILSAKWSFSCVAIESLTDLLIEKRVNELQSRDIDLVLPIPQSWQNRTRRRFNQAARIGHVLAMHLEVSLEEHVLCRSRNSRPQKRVAANSRYDNQKGAFRLKDPHVVKGANILLTDDVLTTGATCSEAARLLKDAGAKSVSVAVLARVLSPR